MVTERIQRQGEADGEVGSRSVGEVGGPVVGEVRGAARLAQILERFPRKRYTPWVTPIEKAERLTELLGGPEIFIKRDDQLGLAEGGNKTRKLEFVMADALAQGADTVYTCGAPQSNHCRLTLAAAIKEGLECRLFIEERVPGTYHPDANGNNLLYRLMGAAELRVFPGGTDMNAEMERAATALAAQGRRPYVIPGGSSNAMGALGYVAAAHEIVVQAREMDLSFSHVVCASGSGGTHAGLVAGLCGAASGMHVIGVSVRFEKSVQEGRILHLVRETYAFLGLGEGPPDGAVECVDDYVGPGYSLPTPEMIEAVNLAARTEGLLLDPVYTGKAMAGLIDMVRKGRFSKDDRVLFVHTGGTPGLYAYAHLFMNERRIGTA